MLYVATNAACNEAWSAVDVACAVGVAAWTLL